MKIKYDKETDIIYIRFSENEVAETKEEKQGVLMDYDKNGDIVAIEILNASKRTEFPNSVIYEVA